MSAKLLAELDTFYGGQASGEAHQSAAQTATAGSSLENAQPGRSSNGNAAAELVPAEEEDFGEFEGPSPSITAQPSVSSVAKPSPYDPWADMQWSARQTPLEPHRQVIQSRPSSRVPETVSNKSVFDLDVPSKAIPKRQQRPAYDDNVLFDAEADDDDDDESGESDGFGAFEEAAASNSKDMTLNRPVPAVVLGPIEPRPAIWEAPKRRVPPNLLDFDEGQATNAGTSDILQKQGQIQSDVISDLSGWEAFEDAKVAQTTAIPQPQALETSPVIIAQDPNIDAWEDFDSTPPATTSLEDVAVDDQAPINLPTLLSNASTSNAVPPTNIPPPAVLFTLFPRIFDESQAILFEPLSRLAGDTDQRLAIMTHPRTKRFLHDYLDIAVTCAHIVAGRKSRWKRDAMLAQSMRIGPASTSGKSGGMKLAGLDKSENAREEREAAEVVAAWKRQAGKLRTALAGVTGLPRPPELSDVMPIRMATQAEGALNAAKACVLCGLKRNERINKVDVDVQDSFGECSLNKSLPSGDVTSGAQPQLYWASQIGAEVPTCYARPANVDQVATVVRVAEKYHCPFAIRGGGHSDITYASNFPGGLTLDLGAFQAIKTSNDRKVTRLGAGLNWGQIYKELDPHNLTVVGGRESSVGLAGLTLGGGISYFSGLYGLACDNVKNFEVVLAGGQIVNANATGKHKDLYKALRGGGNNFGVVTHFDLDTYEHGLMQGGLVAWSDSKQTQNALLGALDTFAHTAQSDPSAASYVAVVYYQGAFSWAAGLEYAKPSPEISTLPVFAPYYTAELNKSVIQSTERTTTLTELAVELGNSQPSGHRQQFHTGTYRANSTLANIMVGFFREEVARVLPLARNATGISPNFALQPISSNIFKQMRKNDGNVLGLHEEDGPLMIFSCSWPWDSPEDDELIIGAMQNIVSRSKEAAKSMGLFNEFIYMNYAQTKDLKDVIPSYGHDNVRFLRGVSKKYDPLQTFQHLVSGGFKLPVHS